MVDTIYAASTVGLPSAIAIIRLSGPQTRFAIETITGSCPEPRYAAYRVLKNPDDQTPIDRGLVLWFPGPESFTGEDSGEFQVHGSRAVVEALLGILRSLPGLRIAEAGEFTYRAFLNGKMDLTAVEGLADLIAAETETQRRQALRQGEGRLGTLYDIWRKDIVHARAMIEAELDFADEEDVPGSASDQIWPVLKNLGDAIRDHCAQSTRAQAIRSGLSVVLQGHPNAGKSSLLNALSKREAAIVSEEAGTTRDVVTVNMNLGGYLFAVSDTAGIREAGSLIEAEGVKRAVAAGRAADLILWLRDGDADGPDGFVPGYNDTQEATVPLWTLKSKSDLIDSDRKRPYADADPGADMYVSARNGEGLKTLESRLIAFAQSQCGTGMEDLSTRTRHFQELEITISALAAAIGNDKDPIEMRAEELRKASDSLGRLTGRIDVEELLGVIFSEFCVGK